MLLPCQLPILEAMLQTVANGWMTILVSISVYLVVCNALLGGRRM